MISDALRQHCLIDELQLEQRLNRSLQQGQQADFALLLAMLSPDVQDQAWVSDPELPDVADVNWRQRFALPPAQPLEADELTLARAEALGDLLGEGGMAAVHLQNCMQAEPLVLKQYQLSDLVWNNLSPLTQEKYRMQQAGETISRHPATAKPADMLDIIDNPMPDLDVHFFDAA